MKIIIKLGVVIPFCILLLFSCEEQRYKISGHWYSERGLFNLSGPTDWYFGSDNSVLTITHLPYNPDSVISYTSVPRPADSCANRIDKDVYRTMLMRIKKGRLWVEYCDKTFDYDYSYSNDSITIFGVYMDSYLPEDYHKLLLIRIRD